MRHEISQFDILGRQKRTGSAQAGMWSDIGEAKITHTIFGRARVRVIREKDKVLRARLLAALGITVLAVAAWQGWIALQQSKLLAVTPPLSERISISPPVFNPETIAPAAARPANRGRPESLIQAEIDSLVANPNRLPPRPSGLLSAKPAVERPAAAQPSMASKTQPAPPPKNDSGSLNQAGSQPPAHVSAPVRPPAQTVASSPAAQPAANKPVPAAPLAEPVSKKDAPKPAPAGNNQTADSANAEQVNARGTPIIFVDPDNTKP